MERLLWASGVGCEIGTWRSGVRWDGALNNNMAQVWKLSRWLMGIAGGSWGVEMMLRRWI